jgi:large subunit ribosomal protein L25
MAKAYPLQVALREGRGSRAARRLRAAGGIPCVLYGHGQDPVHLRVDAHDLEQALHSHSSVFELQWSEGGDTALVHELQLDALGDETLHVDFLRVSLTEKVQVTVPLELHGEPKGVLEGGILNQQKHEVEVECVPTEIPEQIRIEVADLQIGDEIKVSDIPPVAEVQILDDPEDLVVLIQPPAEEEEEEAEELAEMPAEPEVIGRKPKEEEEAEEES